MPSTARVPATARAADDETPAPPGTPLATPTRTPPSRARRFDKHWSQCYRIAAGSTISPFAFRRHTYAAVYPLGVAVAVRRDSCRTPRPRLRRQRARHLHDGPRRRISGEPLRRRIGDL